MSLEVTPDFGAQDTPEANGARLSIALVGPDERRRRLVATAITEPKLANVREFRSYPTGVEDLDWLLGQAYDVVILDVDGDQDVTFDLVQRISARGSTTVMVYSELADQKLAVRIMRAGAREYLLLPLEEGVIAEALARVSSSARSEASAAGKTFGSLLVFLGAKGGSGVTTAACNMAVALARLSEQRTLLIDLTLPIGDAALALGLSGDYSTEDAILGADRLDGSLLKKLLVKHKSGLMVLPAPSKISNVEASKDAINKLLGVARGEFEHVIVDIGSKIDALGTDSIQNATTVYLVTQTSISELRNSNRLISQYFTEGGPKLEVVLNRFEPRLLEAVDEDVVTKALGRPVRWKIPDDQEAAREMQHGETGNSETRISRISAEMASSLTGRPAPQKKKKAFGLKGFSRSLGENFSGNEDPPSVTVAPRAPKEPRVYTRRPAVIKWPTPEPINCGEMLSAAQLNATASVPGTFEYNPGLGEILPAGANTLSVVFIPADSEKHAIAQATVSLEVVRGMPVIEWSNPDPISCGTLLSPKQLCARASVPGTLDYSPALGTELGAGTHTLSVTFTPSDLASYASTIATVSIDVTKAAAKIDWPTPQSIQCGTALSATQLCATASIPGTFHYSPAQGEVLPAGTHELSGTFIPADVANYASTVASVSIEVTKAIPTIDWPPPPPIHEGTRLSVVQLCASASIPGRFIYSPAEGDVLAAGTHSLVAIFTPTDSERYASTQATVPLNVVAKEIPIITWPQPEPIIEGTLLSERQLHATASVPGRFEYTPAAGNTLPVGTHKLSVVFEPTDSAKYASTNGAVSLTVVAKEIPVITWPKPDSIPYGTLLGSAQLCATASVPGTFNYSPAPNEKLPAGTHTLTAIFTPTDSAKYATAQATISLEVSKLTPSIEWPVPQPIKDDTPLGSAQLCATASVPGTFEYSPAPGTTLAAGNQTLSVIFRPADSANYVSTEATASILVVAKPIPVVTWLSPAPITYGTPLSAAQLNATASVPGSFEYSPASGEVPSAGQHKILVTFRPTDSENYASAQATVLLEVEMITPSIDWPYPEPIPYGTGISAAQLCASASVPGTFSYSPEPGEILTAGMHKLTVVFTPADSVNYAPTKATVSFEVTKATPRIDWPVPKPIECGAGLSSAQLCATASVPGRFTYSPAPGEVLPAGNHTLSVSFSPDDAANYVAAQSTVSLEVTKATPSIAWSTPEPITYGALISAAHLCATASVPGKLEYSHKPGEMLTAGKHTLTVRFTPADIANYSEATASISFDVMKAAPIIEWPIPRSIQCGTPLSSTQLCANASVPGTFEYSPEAGTQLPAGTHTLSLTFTPSDSTNYATRQANVPIDVAKGTLAIKWPSPAPITYGTRLSTSQLCATASAPARFDYSPALNEMLAVGTHVLSVTVTPNDSASYDTKTATVSLEVTKGIPIIDWPTPQPVTCDSLLGTKQLCATASIPGTFEYTPAAGEALSAGTHTLSVTFKPMDRANYATTEAKVSLNVEKVNPSLDWPTPRPITSGTALSGNQLCASAWVPGTFVYSPAAGEILSPGTHALSVTFTPADCTSYATAQATVLLNVMEKPKPAITWPKPSPIAYGTPLSNTELCARSSVPGTFDYSPGVGERLAVGTHELSVTFTPADVASYDKVQATVSLYVTKATPVIKWSNPAPIQYGTPLGPVQFCATASVPGTFDYSPVPDNLLKTGKHLLSVNFTPADSANYAVAHANVMIEVTKATPMIEWATPKPIRIGTRLGTSQLCSTASIPGTFYYSPPPGVELPVGSHTLSVSFTPADTEQYGAAHATVMLEVRKQSQWGALVAAVFACLILLLLFLYLPSFDSGKKSAPEQPVQSAPLATDTPPKTSSSKPSTRPKAAQGKSAKAGKSNQQNTLTPIPEEAKKQFAEPPPSDGQADSVNQSLSWIRLRLNQIMDSAIDFLDRALEKIRN